MKESQREEKFQSMKEGLEKDGYQAISCTISILKANVMAFVTTLPIIILFGAIYLLKNSMTEINDLDVVWIIAGMVVCIPIHEFFHGLAWRLHCKNGWKSIHFGVIWDKLTPYCNCMEPLSFKQYLVGVLMPFLVLGIGLFGVVFFLGNTLLLSVCFLNIFAAGGDITISLGLIKYRKAMIIDHPTECGFWAFYKE